MGNLSNLNIDKNVKESGGGNQLLPEGRQQMIIVNSKLMKNSKKTGKILKMALQVINGKFKGIQKIENLNIINKNKEAQEIAQGTLKRICNILKVSFPPEDSSSLHGRPFEVFFTQDIFENEKNEKIKVNKIKGYYKISNDDDDEKDDDDKVDDDEKDDDDDDDDSDDDDSDW